MPRYPGFRWALFVSAMIHVIVFLSVPMGGSVGRARDTMVRTFKETAIQFVTFVKPPPSPAKAQVRTQPRRVVERRIVRRVRRHAPRPRPRPQPAQVQEPEARETPEVTVLPPEPVSPPPTPAVEPEPEPVVIHPTPPPVAPAPMVRAEPQPEAEEAPASPPAMTEVPKAAPTMAATAPAPAVAPDTPEPGPAAPAPTAIQTAGRGAGQAAGPPTPSESTIALAPSLLSPDPGPGMGTELPGGPRTKAAPALGTLPAGPTQTTPDPGAQVPGGTMAGATGPVATTPAAPAVGRASPAPLPAERSWRGSMALVGIETPGATADTSNPGTKAQPIRRAGPPGRELGGAGGERSSPREGPSAAGGRPVRLTTNPRGETVLALGPRGESGWGQGGQQWGLSWSRTESPGAGSSISSDATTVKATPGMAGQGGGTGALVTAAAEGRGGDIGDGEVGGGSPVLGGRGGSGSGMWGPIQGSGAWGVPGGVAGGSGGPGSRGESLTLGGGGGPGGEDPGGPGSGGSGWYLVGGKSSPAAGWLVAVLSPGVGGVGPGGGQGGRLGSGAVPGTGMGEATGPGVGPVGPLAPGSGIEGTYLPAVVALTVGQQVLPSLASLLGVGEGPGTGLGGVWTGVGKLSPLMVASSGPFGVPGGVGGGGAGAAVGAGRGDFADTGGPVGLGLPSAGGTGGLGLLPLPGSEEGLALGGPSATGPMATGGLLGAPTKSAPGGLYVGVTGSFDMPMGITASDYHTDAEGMRNLLAEVRARTNVRVTALERFVPVTLENIRHSPIIHLRGHRPFSFTDEEREVLRQYVAQGGTIFGEDSHGPFGECFRREMKKIFGVAPSDLPLNHEIYRAHYVLDRVPGGDMGERYPLQGIQVGNRLGVIFSRNDYGDCWEGTGGWVRPESREPAFKMGVNIFIYVTAKWNQNRN